jgi:hypothetical protein
MASDCGYRLLDPKAAHRNPLVNDQCIPEVDQDQVRTKADLQKPNKPVK